MSEKFLQDFNKRTLIRFIEENLHFGQEKAIKRLQKIEKDLRIEYLLASNRNQKELNKLLKII